MIEKKKTELYQELGLQARDLRFQHLMSIATRNNKIIMRMEVMVSLRLRVNVERVLPFFCTVLLIPASCGTQPSSKRVFGALPAARGTLRVCPQCLLVTVSLVEPRRNVTNTVVEVYKEPLLTHTPLAQHCV